MIKKHLLTIILGTGLLIISILSLFVGVMDIDLSTLLSSGNEMELNIFLLARIPRLLAILCTGVGMSVAGLIMQQLSTYFVGSFALIIKGNYELVWLVVPLVIIAFIFANYFNIVGIGKDFSKNLGVNYKLVLLLPLYIWLLIMKRVSLKVQNIMLRRLLPFLDWTQKLMHCSRISSHALML